MLVTDKLIFSVQALSKYLCLVRFWTFILLTTKITLLWKVLNTSYRFNKVYNGNQPVICLEYVMLFFGKYLKSCIDTKF